jgi:hypothetical protein
MPSWKPKNQGETMDYLGSVACLLAAFGWTWLGLKRKPVLSLSVVPTWALVPACQDWLLNSQCLSNFQKQLLFSKTYYISPQQCSACSHSASSGSLWQTPSGFREVTDHWSFAAPQPPLGSFNLSSGPQ